ncbi:MAG: acetate--CoA ligase family protein [Deltaproteobacteria bacterium]|nr:acetate--CoA ligase family protein [Deltaproteobacteria bacterium]
MGAESVAIIGISQPDRFGGTLFQSLAGFGYEGEIYGVSPRYESLYDRPCYASIGQLPARPDCALLAVPNSRLCASLEEVAEFGVPAAVIYASAYTDPDESGPSLEARLTEIAKAHDMIVCGPNCMGFVTPARRLSVNGFETNPDTPAGGVTLITHSGSVWEAFLQNRRGVAFNYIVSSGNEIVTTVADYMQHALKDPTTRVIGLFLETVRDPLTFEAALAEATERDIPVVVLKTGRTERGARLARAHSGALAGDDAAYDALFARYGVGRCTSIDEMMDTLELLETGMRSPTAYLSAIHDSGGQRSLLVDLADEAGVELAEISSATTSRLASILEPGLEPINPLDAWGTGNDAEAIYEECLLALDRDPATGLTLFACDLLTTDDPSEFYPKIVANSLDQLTKPLAFMVHLTGAASDHQVAILRDLGVPVLMGTETGLRAAGHMLAYCQYQSEQKSEKVAIMHVAPPSSQIEASLRQLQATTEALDESESKRILALYGLTTTREILVENGSEAVRAAREIGYPVALKTATGDLHKTDRDGVRLGLADVRTLESAYADFEQRLGPRALVQEMIPDGTDLLLGMVNDPQFGPMLTLGTGGIFVEVINDVSMLTLPTNPDTILKTLLALRGAALLRGARGRPIADLDAVAAAAMGLAGLALDLGDAIAEIDINPLRALENRAVVLDALIVPK